MLTAGHIQWVVCIWLIDHTVQIDLCSTITSDSGSSDESCGRSCVQLLTISFNSLDIEDTGNCLADSLSVYDGADTTSPLLGKFCGDELPDDLTSSGHYIYVVFRSNHKRNIGGFSISWSATDAHGVDNAQAGRPTFNIIRLQISLFQLDLRLLSSYCCICLMSYRLSWLLNVVYKEKEIVHNCTLKVPSFWPCIPNSVVSELLKERWVLRQRTWRSLILWSVVDDGVAVIGCDDVSTILVGQTEGILVSPKQPNLTVYPNDVVCNWHVVVPADMVRVTLVFLHSKIGLMTAGPHSNKMF